MNNNVDELIIDDKFEIVGNGEGQLLKINFKKGEKFVVKQGCMVSMDPVFNLTLRKTKFIDMVKRVLSSGSLFLQEYIANDIGELLIGPSGHGEILKIELENEKSYRVSTGKFLGCTDDVILDIKPKIRGFFGSGDRIFVMNAKGNGSLFVHSTGEIIKINLKENQEYLIDSGHLILWESDMEYKSEVAGKRFGISFLSGEGFITRFKGPGTIYMQTRKEKIIQINKGGH